MSASTQCNLSSSAAENSLLLLNLTLRKLNYALHCSAVLVFSKTANAIEFHVCPNSMTAPIKLTISLFENF